MPNSARPHLLKTYLQWFNSIYWILCGPLAYRSDWGPWLVSGSVWLQTRYLICHFDTSGFLYPDRSPVRLLSRAVSPKTSLMMSDVVDTVGIVQKAFTQNPDKWTCTSVIVNCVGGNIVHENMNFSLGLLNYAYKYVHLFFYECWNAFRYLNSWALLWIYEPSWRYLETLTSHLRLFVILTRRKEFWGIQIDVHVLYCLWQNEFLTLSEFSSDFEK